MTANGNGGGRVHWHDDQYLRPQDFNDEQAYHVAMRRRHNLAHHSWGIVAGLDLTVDGDGVAAVGPGFGVDGFGRELVLEARQSLPASAFADRGSDVLEVWLEYDRTGVEPAPAGYVDCGEDPASSPYRWSEAPVVTLRVPDPSYPDPRAPKGVAEADLTARPEASPPDDPARVFPLFLGFYAKPAKPGDPPVVDVTGRPYAGLVGESVRAASGRTSLQIGTRTAHDDYRFGVYVPADVGDDDPVLGVRVNGTVVVDADATIEGDLTLDGGMLELAPGGDPSGARPWRIYHVQDPSLGDELRIEMGTPGADPTGANRVCVGAFGEVVDEAGNTSKQFRPCLTVADDCSVTVGGDLVVGGVVMADGGWASPALSPRAREFINASFLSGVGGASGLLDQVFQGGGATGFTFASGDALGDLARMMVKDPTLVEQFAQALRAEDAATAQKLADALDVSLEDV